MKRNDFLKVYNEYKPNFFVKNFYKYFSYGENNVKTSFGLTLFLSFFISILLCSIHIQPLGKYFILFFCTLLVIFGVLILFVEILERIRIFKIKRKLKITYKQYNEYVMTFVNDGEN